jgi:hypothetical protein
MQIGASAAADRRRHPRYPLLEQARLRPNDWSTIQVVLRDISSHGFRAGCDANLKIGGYVTLEVNGIGQVESKIMWRRNDEVGAEFVRPISLQYCGWLHNTEASIPAPKFSPHIEDTFIDLLARRAARRATEL